MSARPWLGPLLVAVLANVIALGGVVWNRAHVAATLDLTERELAIDRFALGIENQGDVRSLRLTWQTDEPFIDAAGVEALGFDCSVPVDAPDAERHYGRALPREVYLVLEQEGDAWQRWWAKQQAPAAPDEAIVKMRAANLQKSEDDVRADLLAEAQRAADYQLATASRLFVVAAGLDDDALRVRYPDRTRYAIVRGTVSIMLTYGDTAIDTTSAGADAAPRLVGFVNGIATDVIHVERDLAPALHGLDVGPQGGPLDETGVQGPRYRARVLFGARHEPWLEQLARIHNGDRGVENG